MEIIKSLCVRLDSLPPLGGVGGVCVWGGAPSRRGAEEGIGWRGREGGNAQSGLAL